MASQPTDSGQVFTKMEFAVQMSCQSCVDAVKKSLENIPGVRSVYVSLDDEVVLVETVLPSGRVQGLLENTGRLVVLRGFGGTGEKAAPEHHGAAVAIMKGAGGVRGLARLVQVSPEQCVVEATVDGMEPGQHSIGVHQYGDLSEGCLSCGEIYSPSGDPSLHPAGLLGSLEADKSGRGTFQVVTNRIKVWDIIGRSMVVSGPAASTATQEANSFFCKAMRKGLGMELESLHLLLVTEDSFKLSSLPHRKMCGIIARSAGLFQNPKKVCTCDGVTVWDEAQKARGAEEGVRASL